MKTDKATSKAWVKAQGRANRARISIITLLGLLSTLLGLLQGWTLARILAAVISHKAETAIWSLVVFLAASLSRIGLTVVQDLAASNASIVARRRLRQEILQRIVGEGPGLLRRQHSSVIASTIVDRVEALEGYFARWLPAESLWLLSQWLVVAVVFWQNHKAGLILALCCASLPVFQAVFGIATGVASRRQFIAMGRLQTRFLDRVKGIATIVLSGNAEREALALAASADDLRKRTMKVLRIAFIASATTDIAMVVALVLIVINQSHQLLHAASETAVAHALFAVLMVPEAFASFRALSAAYQDRAHATEAATAMSVLAPLPPITNTLQTAPEVKRNGIALQVEAVTFHWDPMRRSAIENVSVALAAGDTLILEGESGAGKSTLMEMLLGFIRPESGRILLDGIDMATMAPRQISDCISWIGQKPVMFAGTIRENILFARPDASAAELDQAVAAAQIASFLSVLPEGLETRIGEGGFGISGGQAQRIAIARAWLKDAPLLLLDEPTAHLDPATEAEILSSLQLLARNRTVVLCSHSAQVRAFPGRHLLLKNGQVAALSGEAA